MSSQCNLIVKHFIQQNIKIKQAQMFRYLFCLMKPSALHPSACCQPENMERGGGEETVLASITATAGASHCSQSFLEPRRQAYYYHNHRVTRKLRQRNSKHLAQGHSADTWQHHEPTLPQPKGGGGRKEREMRHLGWSQKSLQTAPPRLPGSAPG